MTERQLFLQHIAQTSPSPLGLEINKAEGCILWDKTGKAYIDLIAGISVCNIGHCHPAVVKAVQEQAAQYLHIMVYGEFIESPQVQYAQLLTQHLPSTLNAVYFTNSGAEATEGAMKLAKRLTNRTGMVAFNNSYHGSTQGALSIMGSEYWRNAFRPLLPHIWQENYNDDAAIQRIDENIACVIMETVQAESGIIQPNKQWIQAVRQQCTEKGVLFILDEIQAGFGRTSSLWAFEQFNIIPDILLLGKALGGGMPLGAFIADKKIMQALTENPVLGHITTFGGHPVSCAAGMAAMQVLLESNWIKEVKAKEKLFIDQLQHPLIKSIRSAGLWMAIEFESFDMNKKIIDACTKNGLITDWFLFAPQCLRVAPPLCITEKEINEACDIIMVCLKNI